MPDSGRTKIRHRLNTVRTQSDTIIVESLVHLILERKQGLLEYPIDIVTY